MKSSLCLALSAFLSTFRAVWVKQKELKHSYKTNKTKTVQTPDVDKHYSRKPLLKSLQMSGKDSN